MSLGDKEGVIAIRRTGDEIRRLTTLVPSNRRNTTSVSRLYDTVNEVRFMSSVD